MDKYEWPLFLIHQQHFKDSIEDSRTKTHFGAIFSAASASLLDLKAGIIEFFLANS